MTMVYVVFREGVYRHECIGVFSTEEKARAAAEAQAKEEQDGYHGIDCVPFEVDTTYLLPSGDQSIGPVEAAPVFSVRKVSED